MEVLITVAIRAGAEQWRSELFRPMCSAKGVRMWESMLCARYLLSDGCVEWINLDAIRKMAIIRMNGKHGKPGGVVAKQVVPGQSACPAK